MFGEPKASFLGNLVLTIFYLFIEEFFNPTAIQTHEMVVVITLVELEDGLEIGRAHV